MQAASTKHHRLGTLMQQTFTSHSSRGWEIQDQASDRCGVWWGKVPGCRLKTSHCVPTWQKGEGRALKSRKGTNPIHQGSALMTGTSAKGPASSYHHPRVPTQGLWGDTDIQSTALALSLGLSLYLKADTNSILARNHSYVLSLPLHASTPVIQAKPKSWAQPTERRLAALFFLPKARVTSLSSSTLETWRSLGGGWGWMAAQWAPGPLCYRMPTSWGRRQANSSIYAGSAPPGWVVGTLSSSGAPARLSGTGGSIY